MRDSVRPVPLGHKPQGPPLRVSGMPPNAERLIRLMQQVGFGAIEHLHVQDGQPQFTPPPVVTKELRLGTPPVEHHCTHQADFVLKAQVVDLLDVIAQMHSGVIAAIDVRFGLPTRVAFPVDSAA